MLMSGEVKNAKTILKGLQQTLVVITKIQKTEQYNMANREERFLINQYYRYSNMPLVSCGFGKKK